MNQCFDPIPIRPLAQDDQATVLPRVNQREGTNERGKILESGEPAYTQYDGRRPGRTPRMRQLFTGQPPYGSKVDGIVDHSYPVPRNLQEPRQIGCNTLRV